MYSKEKEYVLVLGVSIVDIFGFSTSAYKECDSTPGKIKMSFGGVCRNIAENMARIGVNTKLISVLGDDEKGRSMLDHSKVIGYDMSHSMILKDGRTPTYMAILNENGEMVSAIVDMESINKINKEFIDSKAEVIEQSEYTFLDADNPKILEYILTKYKNKTKFILDPVSACKAKNIRHLVKHFHTIKPNRYEAEILANMEINNEEDLKKAGEYFLSLGVEKVFISLDEEGIYYNDGVISGKMTAVNVSVKNVTGAGDSFVAGLGHAYINELSIEEAVKFAMAMSIITISHEKTIHPDIDYKLVQDNIKSIKWINTVY